MSKYLAMPRKAYPSDVGDDEWAFVAPHWTLMREDAPRRAHELREVFNSVRYAVRSGLPWRWLPSDLPPWYTVYQQAQRWIAAGVFEAMVHDLRAVLRVVDVDAKGGATRGPHLSAVILEGTILQSTPQERAPRRLLRV
jgi:transposase